MARVDIESVMRAYAAYCAAFAAKHGMEAYEKEIWMNEGTTVPAIYNDEDVSEYYEAYETILEDYAEDNAIEVYRDSYTLYYDPVTKAWIEFNFQDSENYIGMRWDEPLGLINEFNSLQEAMEWLKEQELPEDIKKELEACFERYLE